MRFCYFLLVAWVVAFSASVARAQDDPQQRPIVGQDADWYTKWWSWSNDQRRQGGTVINPKGGDLNPALNDPAIQTWRDQNGWNVRPIVPQDLRGAIQMQQNVLGDMKSSILRQEKSINQRIKQDKADFYAAKDQEQQAKRDISGEEANISGEKLQKYNVEQRWDVSRFNRCPNGKSWYDCDHADEKQSWLDDKDRELQPVLDRMARAEQRLANAQDRLQQAREKGNKAYQDLQQAKKDQMELQNRVENFNTLSNRQQNGEPFLFMPK
jgi:hypothetical protein